MGYVVKATWTAREGAQGTVLDALHRLAPLSRAEPGCRYYQPYRDPSQPRVFRIFEVYDDEAAFEAHKASSHFQELALGLAVPVLENREVTVFETIDA